MPGRTPIDACRRSRCDREDFHGATTDSTTKPELASGCRSRKGVGGRPIPPWLWLVMIGLLGLIFWHFVPKTEVQVSYAPWFLEQVDADNIQSLSLQGNEARGVLRQVQTYQGPTSRPPSRSGGSTPTSRRKPRSNRSSRSSRALAKQGSPPVQIEASPPTCQRSGLDHAPAADVRGPGPDLSHDEAGSGSIRSVVVRTIPLNFWRIFATIDLRRSSSGEAVPRRADRADALSFIASRLVRSHGESTAATGDPAGPRPQGARRMGPAGHRHPPGFG